MPRHQNMIAAVLLLCAVGALSDDGKTPPCVPSYEAACLTPADYQNPSGPITKVLAVGMKLIISLEFLAGSPVCHWIRGEDRVMTARNGSQSMVTSPLSETDSGEYTLTCKSNNVTMFSTTVILHVMKRPTKPQLMLDGVDVSDTSPLFKCISEGFPKPTIKWSGNKDEQQSLKGSDRKTERTISSTEYYNRAMMCCATNAEGQECSQLYDYDLQSSVMNKDEVSTVTLSEGQSLLLRCRVKGYSLRSPVWEKGGKHLNARTLSRKPEKEEEMCIKNDSYFGVQMAYLSIRSVREEHNGTYTCTSENKNSKSVHVNVSDEGFLSAQLDETKIISAQEASSTCLQATVSYHPVLQYCSWETPDKNRTKCVRETWVTQHRTVKLCDPLISGDYKLHLEAGGQKETKIISVCVVDEPKFNFLFNKDDGTLNLETVSLVPANYTWMFCSKFNDSCSEIDSSWDEVPNAFQIDSDVSCYKPIKSLVSKDVLKGDQFRFCLTNSVGSWCKTHYMIIPPTPQPSIGKPPEKNSFLLTVCVVLALALTLAIMVLTYFVKKKQKPQYQPQLQMIQMTGPSDNDYIYINFKDFEYDRKWEFPRENLELGKELGSGAFGMVVQATAYGIKKPGVSQKVAVKMLKEKHQSMEKEALMSELKMLTHIGHHANIVNLLGACTDSGPVYLIFQYCCHGDLLNYLKNNCERYHKSVTDAFDKDRFRSLYHNLQLRKCPSALEAPVDNYVPMYTTNTRGQEDIALLTINSDDVDSCEEHNLSADPESFETSDEQTEDLEALTFDDLLSFAFQVARGMEFLSSKNCIHRDLAARNVLVTNGRQVKIGDFGLARDIDNDSNYVVRGNVRLPVKWMAPESIFQGMYTMKSDVWAYGILLWEIFSLGVTPYPGIKVDHMFYSMIERGFKMECPYYANETVYGMMHKCWALAPANRPSFSKLVSFLCDLLLDQEENLYQNTINQTCSDYQNASTIVDMSALTKASEEKKTQATNDYCQTCATEEKRAETCDGDTVAAEKELLKPSDAE
ncbi:receptor-type tyrosine-protein kinase FLT3 isoform X1 [Astatotilapia calliptera]|uniref:receptor-type tyrosine-protein kinase FLT3 isoform X1 n=1 Tax=Astatotilapia calliptera TaxID=8154 RepID=UPI000E418CAF|nr:receptor-type tyrosine-protein kinase FLT3 isoform X1 [Astatotilapia calliptera]